MKSIAVNLLKPGLVFTEPVYIDESNILVPAGIPLRQKDIDKLKTWGVDTVKTNGDTVRTEAEKTALAQAAKSEEAGAPAAGKTAHSALSLSEVQEKKGAYRIYLSLIERLNVIFL
ncbi:MAG: HD-GYP domain-containing protein, partial [Treponema sp.]|nr:HD-GYP domain-containing protein [Treponema sp.]